jgi:hypothetical protein
MVRYRARLAVTSADQACVWQKYKICIRTVDLAENLIDKTLNENSKSAPKF